MGDSVVAKSIFYIQSTTVVRSLDTLIVSAFKVIKDVCHMYANHWKKAQNYHHIHVHNGCM